MNYLYKNELLLINNKAINDDKKINDIKTNIIIVYIKPNSLLQFSEHIHSFIFNFLI